jgi:hypothetical protein
MKMFKVLLMVVLAVVVTGGTAYAGVTLVTPNGGETWTQGSTQDITWNYTGGPAGNVKLTLTKGTVEQLIKDNIPMKDKKYSWKVGEYAGGTAPAGSDYKIKITKQNSSFEDISNGTFTISAATTAPATSTNFSKELIGKVEMTVRPQLPPLYFTFPKGGETFEVDIPYPVKWEGSSVGSGNVEICVKNSNIPCATVPNTGNWQWKIPENANYGSFKMSIKVPGTNTQAESDGTFKITNPYKIKIIYPNGGEVWKDGQTYQIKWDTGGGWAGKVWLYLADTDVPMFFITSAGSLIPLNFNNVNMQQTVIQNVIPNTGVHTVTLNLTQRRPAAAAFSIPYLKACVTPIGGPSLPLFCSHDFFTIVWP